MTTRQRSGREAQRPQGNHQELGEHGREPPLTFIRDPCPQDGGTIRSCVLCSAPHKH